MFDAGAIVGYMILDRTKWVEGMQSVQKSVEDAQDRFTRMNRLAQEQLNKTTDTMIALSGELKSLSRQFVSAGKNLAFFGAGITGPFILAFNSMKDISSGVAEQVQRLKNVTQTFQLELATALVPIVEKLVNILGGLVRAFQDLDPTLRTNIIQWTFLTGVFFVVGGLVSILVGKIIALGGILIGAAAAVARFLGPWGLVLGVVLSVAAAFGKLNAVLSFTMNVLEGVASGIGTLVQLMYTGLLVAVDAIAGAFLGLLNLVAKTPGIVGETAAKLAADLEKYKTTTETMVEDSTKAVEALAKNTVDAFKGKGAVTESIGAATDGLEDFLKKIRELMNTKMDFPELRSSFSMIRDAWEKTAQGMASAFSDFFYDAVTGQLKSLKDYFADFGRTVLRILTDVLAKLLITQLFGSINIGGSTPFNLMGGHAEGIEEVPHSGMYKLHAGEKVVPKYDAERAGSGRTIEIHNFITPEVVAAAMASKAGEDVVTNIINRDALSRGPIRRTLRTT